MTAGQETVKFLKPFGCILVIVLTIAVMATLLSSTKEPIEGYEPPHDSEYYAMHLDELKTELEENVFPHIGGVDRCEITDDTLTIYFEAPDFVIERAGILRYYDVSLFVFSPPEK